MSFTEIKRREIKRYLLRKIDEDDKALLPKIADAFGISSTSVKRYIDAEISEGHIRKDTGCSCGYTLVFSDKKQKYDLAGFTEREDALIYEDILPFLDVNDRAKRIWRYVLPEMFNNALEHSEGSVVEAYVKKCCLYCEITIVDNGVGIFRKVMDALKRFGYPDPLIEDAVIELYKGKFTSCPERHTGEGIFFSMKMMDRFAIISDGNILRSGYANSPSFELSHLLDYAMKLTKTGTVVVMKLENDTERESREVFNLYADDDEGIVKTRIPVFEACLDRDPVARSQARRLCARLSGFKEAEFDFVNVDMMGQGFADEVFRVYHNAHPEVKITPINMNEDVHWMYKHAVNTKVEIPDYSDM